MSTALARRDSSFIRIMLFRSMPRSRSMGSRGVTLLELMVALGLLAMLLLVAWSLFDNLQKAEERSAGLAHRVQVLRQIRSWLTEDLDHLVLPDVKPTANNSSSPGVSVSFVGDSAGFLATVAPSLDPLPFLQEAFESPATMLSNPSTEDTPEGEESLSVYDTDQDRAVRMARRTPWAMERVNVEYRLESQANGSIDSNPTPESDLFYNIVRRERLFTDVGPASPDNSSLLADSGVSPSLSTPAADRQLTIRDLYRQTDESLDTSSPALEEKSLPGIQNASFQYFDGKSWRSEWDSRKENAFPAAIAIQFDFPSRTKARLELAQRRQQAISSDNPGDDTAPPADTFDTLLAQQSKAQAETGNDEQFLVETSPNEVTIVVATHYRSPRANPSESESPSVGRSTSSRRPDTRSNP